MRCFLLNHNAQLAIDAILAMPPSEQARADPSWIGLNAAIASNNKELIDIFKSYLQNGFGIYSTSSQIWQAATPSAITPSTLSNNENNIATKAATLFSIGLDEEARLEINFHILARDSSKKQSPGFSAIFSSTCRIWPLYLVGF